MFSESAGTCTPLVGHVFHFTRLARLVVLFWGKLLYQIVVYTCYRSYNFANH